MPLSTIDKVPVFDASVPVTEDGSSGVWWRESHVPVVPTGGYVDLVSGLIAGATTYPRAPLPGAMMAPAAPAWLGLLRFRQPRRRIFLRLTSSLPASMSDSPDNVFRAPGPDFSGAVEASLRIAVRYRSHAITLAVPTAQGDPYNFPYPAPPAGGDVSAMISAIQADIAADTAAEAAVACLNSAAVGVLDLTDPADPRAQWPGYEEAERALYPTETAVYALEIDHPAAGTVRVVNDAADHVIGGDRYVALRFAAAEATDADGEVTHAEIQVDNVGREMTQWIERSGGGIGATVRVMRINARDAAVEWDLTLDVASIRVDANKVYVSMGFDPLLSRPACAMRHDPDTTPGIF